MGTQTIVIGQTCTTKKLVPIEFNKILTETLEIVIDEDHKPTDFNFIELITKNYCSINNDCWDLMFAYRDSKHRERGLLLIGKWNDGVVE